MTDKNNQNLIAEMKEMLGEEKKLTVENIVFDEHNEPGYDTPIQTEFEDEEKPKQTTVVDSSVNDVINKIRVLSLQGISKLAEHPDSLQYDTLKKVWQLIDKTVEVKK